MFAVPSLQRPYTLCSSLDPALDLPEVPDLTGDAKPEDVATRDALLKERRHALKVAQDTGDWNAIVKSGEKPTMFHMRPIHGATLTWLLGEVNRKTLTDDEGYELAFRLAVKEIENFNGKKLEFVRDDGHVMADPKSLAPLYDIGRDAGQPQLGRVIVLEIGMLAYTRAVQGVSPLS